MPPGATRGHSWIHDPKIANETEVKAQVKLKFRNVTGKLNLISKNCVLRVNPRGRFEFKMLDTSLTTTNAVTQEKESYTFKQTDMDKETPQLFGVPKAILDHVLFCHQEEASWPLADSTEVKKRFDAIFATSRYSKLLVNMRDKKKELNNKIKVDKAEIEGTEQLKEISSKMRNELAATRARYESLSTSLRDLEAEQETILSQIKKSEDQQNTVKIAEQKLLRLSTQTQTEQTSLNEMHSSLAKLLTDSDEFLEEKRGSLGKGTDEVEGGIPSIEEELRKQDSLVARQEKMLEDNRKNSHSTVSLMDSIEREYTKLNSRYSELCKLCGIAAPDVRMDGSLERDYSDIDEIKAVLQNRVKEKIRGMNQAVIVARQNMDQEVEKLRSDLTRLTVEKEQTRSRFTAIKKEISTARNKLHSIFSSSSASRELETLKSEVDALNTKLHSVSESKSVQEITQEIESLESKKTAYEETVKRANLTLAAAREKKRLSDSILKSQAEINKIQKEVSSKIGNDGFDSNSNNVSGIHSRLANSKSAIKSLRSSLNSCEREHSKTTVKLQQLSNEISQKNARISEISSQFAHLTQDVPSLLKQAKYKVAKATHFHAETEAGSLVYQGFRTEATTTSACPVCDRSFEVDELSVFLKNMSIRLENVPQMISKAQSKMEKARALVEKLEGWMPDWEEKCRLEKEILKKDDLEKLENEEREYRNRVNDLKNQLSEATDLNDRLSSALPELRLLERLQNHSSSEILALRKLIGNSVGGEREVLGIDDDEGDDLDLMVGLSDSVDIDHNEIASEIPEIEGKLKKSEAEMKKSSLTLSQVRNTLRSITEMERKIHSKESRIASLEKTLGDSNVITDELNKRISALHEEMKSLETTTLPLNSKIEIAQNSLTSRSASLNSDLVKLQHQLEGLSRAKSLVEECIVDIRSLSDKSLSELRASCDRDKARLNEMENIIRNTKQKRTSIARKLEKVRRTSAEQEGILRLVEDNIRYRQKKKKFQELEREREEAARIFQNITSRTSELRTLQSKFHAMSQKTATLRGQISAIEEEMRKQNQTLNSRKFANAHSEWSNKMVESTAHEMCVRDIDTCIAGLDRALSAFHQQKISEINRIIKEYWQSTYRGADIDTVEIRADDENPNARSSRSFNYRVVMIKGDVVLDLRGRCSAGQKVLVCIIVRLALAESFGVNCGVVTLDEPTTNLDRANRDSFATQLVNIIQRRADSATFQVIVISHDEEFVEMLGGHGQFCDQYYRVSKNDDGHSIIEKQRF